MKILHAADFHLDSPFGRLDGEKAACRRRELRELPARLAELVRAEQVDLVLLPGDLFDGERVYPETLEALKTALAAMAVPVVIAPGNHDCCRPGSPYLTGDWPGNVYIFTDSAMAEVDLPGLNCAVHGCAFTESHREDRPLADFAAPADGRLHLLCIHGEVGRESRYAPLPPDDLVHSGAAYAALGHIHAGTGIQREGTAAWAYPGCPEGRGFDELGPKGVLLITVDETGVTGEFRPVCRRQYRIEELDAAQFADQLPDGSPDLVRYILTGEYDPAPDLAALTALAAPHFFHLELRDATTLPRQLWARAEEDSLTGLFLREMAARLEAAPQEDREQILLATRFGLAALEGREDIRP